MRRTLSKLLDTLATHLSWRIARRLPAPVLPPMVPVDAARDVALTWGLKSQGSELARRVFNERIAPRLESPPPRPGPVPLTSNLCESADIESDWFLFWCHQMRLAPIYHRKLWEDCFAAQVMAECDLLRPGVKALSFGVGNEPLPSLLAREGVSVLATDLPADAPAASAWIATDQHATPARLFRPEIVDRETFDRRVAFRAVDMNRIPPDLTGQFDLCWSLCALEHVGTTALAFQFVLNSMQCLKPGGIAIHTTEFNLSSNDSTLTSGTTVLFTRGQIEHLVRQLQAAGHEVFAVNYSPGSAPLDQYVDLPPFPNADLSTESPYLLSVPQAPHLRLALGGFVTTSIGLVVRRGAALASDTAPAAPGTSACLQPSLRGSGT
jgi:2-polyprenyl-3-methyl-5-hydroxy-6-metoxy-1,4-benzoquinol methylase